MMVFGVPIERLREIGARHQSTLVLSEVIGLEPLETDDDIAPDEFVAFMKFRGAAALRSVFGADVAAFQRETHGLADIGAELVL